MREALGPLRHRDFRLLFAGRVVSVAGSAMAPIAIAFGVLDLGGSAGELGLVLTVAILPQLVLLLAGGVIADRLPRHLVIVVSNLASGVVQTVAAVPAAMLQPANALLGLTRNATNIGGAAVGGVVVAAAGPG